MNIQKENVSKYFAYVLKVSANTQQPSTSNAHAERRESSTFILVVSRNFADFREQDSADASQYVCFNYLSP